MKKIVATLLAMASFCLVGNVSAELNLSAWQAQAEATSGNVVADTTGWTFDGTAGVSFDYGALDEIDGKPVDGSTIEYIFNITDAATSTALGSMLGWSPGGEINVLKLEQWNNTGVFGFTVPGLWDYTLATASTFDQDVQVVFRRNNDGGTIDLFVNGVFAETDTNKTDWRQDGGVGMLGSSNTGGDVPTGVIYAVGTYDVALTNQQIANLFNPLLSAGLIPDSFDLYADTSDLSSSWTVSGGVLSLETTQTHNATPKSMKVDYAGPVLITKDLSQDFDYSGYDGKNLVLWFLGQASNTPGDLTFSVLDSDDLIIESLTLFSATTRDYWSTTGTLVDTQLQPDWSRVRKIQIEITGSGTMYFDNLSFETNYQAVAGDLNFDNRVNIQDLLLFLEQWLDVNCFGFGCADLDGVGGVDMKDFALLAQNWMMKSSSLVISEFMAVNSYVPFVSLLDISTTVDGVVEHPDWIEIHNSDLDAAVSTSGWYLTDDATNLTKWRFPDVIIPAGGYLVVYASRKTQDEHPGNYPYVDDDSHFHTNFKLSNNGEYLALVESDGITVAHEYAPAYPRQRGLISYGIGSNYEVGYLQSPTVGSANSAAYAGVVADTKFSVDRGLYRTGDSFDMVITCTTPGVQICYTLDKSTPTSSHGTVYSSPIHINATTCLRAAAFKAGWLESDVDTQTYIFLDDVITQSPNGETPGGWPSGSVNGQVLEYGMDPDIVNSVEYGPLMIDAMRQIPSISLVTDMDNLFDPSIGIYVNAYGEGIDWERPTSVELINPDGSKGFQINAGLRIRGGYSRTSDNPKHSLRLLFKGGYGPGELEYDMFDNEGVDQFDNIDLRTAQNYAWSNWGNDGSRNTFIRDVYSRDLQREINQSYTRSRYYHLYLNGVYWGLYQSQERSEASYAESYFGSHEEYYDVIKTDDYHTSYTDGSLDKWNQLWFLCDAGLETDEKYYAVQGKDANGNDDLSKEVHVDVDNLIDYMIVIFFTGNRDAPVTLSGTSANNFYAIRNRLLTAREGWRFYAYDSEHSMLYVNEDRTINVSAGTSINDFNPQWLHQKIMVHPEYKMRFADRAHKFFFNGGPMTPENAAALCLRRASEFDLGIIGESARWGDHRSDRINNPYTKAHWWAEVNGYLVNTFLPGRTQTVLNQLKNKGLYPNVEAPSFNQHGGVVNNSFELTMAAPAGTIYYTLDGSDPRLPGGAVNSSAQIYSPGSASQSTLIAQGSIWKYLDDGSDQGTVWRNIGFNDNPWDNGPAELGYGDGDEATTVGYGPDSNNKYITTYFRHTFNLADTSSITGLTLSLLRDDGAVVYLNGTEVARSNMPTGTIDYLTPASTYIEDDDTFFGFSVDPGLLVVGDNVVSVEIHQNSGTSSDISLDLYLIVTLNSGGSAVILNESTRIKARVLDAGQWSAKNEATYVVGPVAENLRITEMMYHPATDPNSEFIELKNIATEPININLVRFTNGIDFTFSSVQLTPNQYVLVVKNINVFESQYGAGLNIAGEYTGSLDNTGEKIELVDPLGTEIHNFSYKDSWYDITDGEGFSLTIKDPNSTDPNNWDSKSGWRSSAAIGGSPGVDDSGMMPESGAVKINEVLAHSDVEVYDWIELYNTTNEVINIGGWFLSDSNKDDPNRMKYEIAPDTTIDPNGYLIFYENMHFGNVSDPGCHTPFALSENGETVYLQSGQSGVLTGYYEEEDFGASEPDIAFGRYIKSVLDGGVNFVAMSTNTPGSANAYPKVGPLVIDEIMYHPPTNPDAEYVELRNISGSTVTLYDSADPADVSWQFTDEGGFDFLFSTGGSTVTITAGERILLVKNYAAFDGEFGDPGGVQIFVWGPDGSLSNGGEKVNLSLPGDVDGLGVRQYIRIDRVNYDDVAPWPTTPDGDGDALTRKIIMDYGNDVDNWQAGSPTPGL